MKKLFYLLLTILFTSFILITACKKEEEEDIKKNPVISFIKDSGYTYEDVELEEGDTILVGINATYNGVDKLDVLTITANDQVLIYSTNLDKMEFEYGINIIKSEPQTEEWVFTITDKGNLSANVSLTLTKTGE
ncbi:MAG: hypothetical protein KAT68_01110 [Bacteroidales bacterium]|nr:hypothetical protein [Bacteroidales bacterium]